MCTLWAKRKRIIFLVCTYVLQDFATVFSTQTTSRLSALEWITDRLPSFSDMSQNLFAIRTFLYCRVFVVYALTLIFTCEFLAGTIFWHMLRASMKHHKKGTFAQKLH